MKATSHVKSTSKTWHSNQATLDAAPGAWVFAENPWSCFHPVAGGRNETDWWRQTGDLLPIEGEGWRQYFPVSRHWVTPSVVILDLIKFPKEFPGPTYLLYWQLHQCELHQLRPTGLTVDARRLTCFSIHHTGPSTKRSKIQNLKRQVFPRNTHCLLNWSNMRKGFWFHLHLTDQETRRAFLGSRICSVRVCFSNAKTNNMTLVMQGVFSIPSAIKQMSDRQLGLFCELSCASATLRSLSGENPLSLSLSLNM